MGKITTFFTPRNCTVSPKDNSKILSKDPRLGHNGRTFTIKFQCGTKLTFRPLGFTEKLTIIAFAGTIFSNFPITFIKRPLSNQFSRTLACYHQRKKQQWRGDKKWKQIIFSHNRSLLLKRLWRVFSYRFGYEFILKLLEDFHSRQGRPQADWSADHLFRPADIFLLRLIRPGWWRRFELSGSMAMGFSPPCADRPAILGPKHPRRQSRIGIHSTVPACGLISSSLPHHHQRQASR